MSWGDSMPNIIETRPSKFLIYTTIIVKIIYILITPITQWEPNIQRIYFIITPVKGTNYQSLSMG